MVIETVAPRECKHCGSSNVVRFGHSKVSQRLRCKECEHTFLDGDSLPKMKTPAEQIAGALSMYYGGMSLEAIRRYLDQHYGNRFSDSTIYDWIIRFTKVAVDKAREYKPDVGDIWLVDENALTVGRYNVWCWDVIDTRTRFLLASHMSLTRTARDAKGMVERAFRRAGIIPRIIIAEKLQTCLGGIKLALDTDTSHIPVEGLRVFPNGNLIERFHITLKDRTKVISGFKRCDTVRLVTNGWLVHYNFFRPHEALRDRTPAEEAAIKFPFGDWLDITRQSNNNHIVKE